MNRRELLMGVLVTLGVAALGGSVIAAPFTGISGRWVNASLSDEDQIVSVVKAANDAKAIAARTFDVGRVSALYVDDPSVPLTSVQQAALSRIAPGVVGAGARTFQLAYFDNWRRGAAAFQRVQAALRSGRRPDPADVAASIPPRLDPVYELPMTVHSVTISGDYAYVEAETEATHFRVTLVRRAQQWLIAGEANRGKD